MCYDKGNEWTGRRRSMISKQSPLPLYYQLEEYLKQQIESGEWKPGDIMPSERELSEEFRISRMTVRQALTNLVNKNILFREKGRGTFVSHRKFEQNLQGLTSFSEDMERRGLASGSKLLYFEQVKAGDQVAEALAISPGDPVYKLKRIRLADQEPLAVETSYNPVSLFPELDQKIFEKSLYHYIEENRQMRISHGTQTVEAALVTDEDAQHLMMEEGQPVLLIQRVTHLEDGRPFELVWSIYRGDSYKYRIEMNRR